MRKASSSLLIPITFGLLLPAAGSAASNPASNPVETVPPPQPAETVASPRIDAPVGAIPDIQTGVADGATYGEQLTELARRAARRAATNQGSDLAMEAISELAARWLVTPEGATRVWDRRTATRQSARKAIRNEERSLVRKERRHERIAQSAPTPPSIAPGQIAAVELDELASRLGARDRELLGYSAQGMNAREIAELLGISHDAARQRLARARRQLD